MLQQLFPTLQCTICFKFNNLYYVCTIVMYKYWTTLPNHGKKSDIQVLSIYTLDPQHCLDKWSQHKMCKDMNNSEAHNFKWYNRTERAH